MEYKYKKLTPFKMQCLTNFPFIDEDFDALSNYGLLCKIVEYLNEISKNNNTLIDNIDSLNNWFKNLDVQDEINNKLDEMAESGQLADIIAQYLNLAGVLSYNTVADMKNANNLVNGSSCQTLGYHTLNDGGSAKYKIRTITNEDIIDESFIISLNNPNLIAELIIEKELNVQQIGCYGDNLHDDSEIIQKAINKDYDLYFPNKTYLLNNSLNIINKGNDNKNYNFNGINAKFNYTGNNYAFNIRNTQNANLKFGYINSENGGNINMFATSYSDFIQYLTIECKVLKANNQFANIYAETSDDGWINEITFQNGRIYGNSKYGFHINYGCNNWNFNNIGFEGCETGVYFQNTNSEHSMGHYTFNECRHQESITKVIKADGWVKDVFINYPWAVNFYLIDINNLCTDWKVYSVDNTASILINGKWYFSKTIKTLEGGLNVVDNTDLNSLTIPGDYNFITNNSINTASNFPPTTRQGKLTVEKFSNYFNTGDSAIVQSYVSKIGERFTRAFLNNNWLRWIKNDMIPSIYLTANSDLNNCTLGSYYCDSHAIKITLQNTPSSLADVFRLDIKLIGDITTTRIQQTIYDINGNIFTRVYNGASWTDWKSL